MQFCDALQIGQPRRTKEGYLAVRARSARTGVYQYAGRQVDPENKHGLRDEASVNVLRDEATVFDKRAAQTFVGKPITVDHPAEPVTAANWKDHARGAIMGALRDGDYLAFDLLLMDAAAIADVEAGKRELSNGYAAELEFGDFEAPDGTKCPVRQATITDGNHIAIVAAGRAGPECRISDGGNHLFETCDAATVILADQPTEIEKMPHTLTIDGLQVPNVSDEAKAAIEKLQGQVRDEKKARETADASVATLTTEKAALDAKVVTLEQQVKDAEVTPARLQQLADERAKVIAAAQEIKPGLSVDGKTIDQIRKDAVTARLGDKAEGWSDAQIAASFASLGKAGTTDAILPIGQPATLGDGSAVRNLARQMQYN